MISRVNLHSRLRTPVRCALAVMLLGALLSGCDLPGKPTRAQQWQSPHAIVDFNVLFAQNCRGCHGAQGEVSGAINLDNATYLAVVPPETLRKIVANGVPGTAMIGFSETSPRARPLSRLSVQVVTALKEQAPKPALSCIPLIWASLAINTCVPLLSPDATWGAQIFRTAFPAGRCRERKSPALSPGWPRTEETNSDSPSP